MRLHPSSRPGRSRLALGAALVFAGTVVSACSSGSSSAPTTTTRPVATTTTEQPGWSSAATGLGGTTAVEVQTSTGGNVTVLRFRTGETALALHVGTQDPPVGSAAIGPNNSSVIGPSERPVLLAAFNGGFNSSAGVGGMAIDGLTLVPMVDGDATVTISPAGVAHLGIWGTPGFTSVSAGESVRQNLAPLVVHASPATNIADVSAWGATFGGVASAARSALGVDAQGNVLFAASMHATPQDMADALIHAGATTAMELDINPEWVQADVAATPGAVLGVAIPGQVRPSDQYLTGWTRDFFTVVAAHNS